MKYFLVLFSVAVCQGLAIHKTLKDIPRPDLRVLTALDPPALLVEWGPVQYEDPKEPILGYKVKVWELPPVKTYKYVDIDGVRTLIEEQSAPKIGDALPAPEDQARETIVSGPLASKVKIPDIKLNVIYEVRVRAFTQMRNGPLSTHMRVQLMDDKDDRDNEIYHFV